MSRFYCYDEIVNRQPTPVDDLLWLAGEISKLPPFAEGVAVLCGSAVWGQPTSRSDIDVAHFATPAFPNIRPAIEGVIEKYRLRTGDRFVCPRADVITIGAQTEQLYMEQVSLGSGTTAVEKKHTVNELFVSTGVRYSDHIGAIARVKAAQWRAFYGKYLATVKTDPKLRSEVAMAYVSDFTSTWNSQPLHILNLGPDMQMTPDQLKMIGLVENYPIHVMRHLLGYMGRYPSPDRDLDIHAAFSSTPDLWPLFRTSFEPFLDLEPHYMEVVAAARRPDGPLTASQYYEAVRSLVTALPFTQLEQAVVSWFDYQQRYEEEAERTRQQGIRQREETERQRKLEEERARLTAKQRIDEEAYRARKLYKSSLPWWLRWLW
jgi:hypothetical protein